MGEKKKEGRKEGRGREEKKMKKDGEMEDRGDEVKEESKKRKGVGREENGG